MPFRSRTSRCKPLTRLQLTMAWDRFNPRPHAGGNSDDLDRLRERIVSIHAPTRGATARISHPCWAGWFQSTPPRGGQPLLFGEAVESGDVSIHAPTRGGNRLPAADRDGRAHVSIHAPTRGATRRPSPSLRPRDCFNPRPHAGGNAELLRAGEGSTHVSIHAPTRGATWAAPTPTTARPGFNPRPHAGGNPSSPLHPAARPVSIHAPTRGATFIVFPPWNQPGVSIHAPTRGATGVRDGSGGGAGFQSTPPRGGQRPQALDGAHLGLVSIHAPTRGATRLRQ